MILLHNPLGQYLGLFDNYELQKCQEYACHDGNNTFVEPCFSRNDVNDGEKVGKPFWAVYGHITGVGVEHLFDRATKAMALKTLKKMGIS